MTEVVPALVRVTRDGHRNHDRSPAQVRDQRTATDASDTNATQGACLSSRRRLRWVTWWPIPYWTDRFDELGRQLGDRFEAVFLTEAPAEYPEISLRPEIWEFHHRILSQGNRAIGFGRRTHVPFNPFSITSGGSPTVLVMTYADLVFIASAMIARVRRIPYHLFVANTRGDMRTGRRDYELLKRWIFSGAKSCLVTGPHQEQYARLYAPSTTATVIGNPVNNDILRADAIALQAEREALRADWRWNPEDFVVAFVGRFALEKDIPTLLRAVAKVCEHHPRVSLVLVGAGPERSALERLAEALGIDARFPGFLQGRPLHEIYAMADVFVLPSLSEPWGLVVNEAMLFGLPVVVSDRVGSRHLVEGGGGFVFRAGDDDALAARLWRLMSDECLRCALGATALRTIAPHTIPRWADSVLDAVHISV